MELLVAITIMAALTVVLDGGADRHRTAYAAPDHVARAEVQAACRQTIALMATELRQAGADHGFPPSASSASWPRTRSPSTSAQI